MDKLKEATRLRNAAQWFRDNEWGRNHYMITGYHLDLDDNNDSPVLYGCAIGGYLKGNGYPISASDDERWTPEMEEAEGALVDLFQPVLPDNGSTLSSRLPGWNDTVATSKQDVIDLFEGMAFQLEVQYLAEEAAKVEDETYITV